MDAGNGTTRDSQSKLKTHPVGMCHRHLAVPGPKRNVLAIVLGFISMIAAVATAASYSSTLVAPGRTAPVPLDQRLARGFSSAYDLLTYSVRQSDFAAAMGETRFATGAETQRTLLGRMVALRGAAIPWYSLFAVAAVGYEAAKLIGTHGVSQMPKGRSGTAIVLFIAACFAGAAASMEAAQNQRLAAVLTQSAYDAANLPSGQSLVGIARAHALTLGTTWLALGFGVIKRAIPVPGCCFGTAALCNTDVRRQQQEMLQQAAALDTAVHTAGCHLALYYGFRARWVVLAIVLLAPILFVIAGLLTVVSALTIESLEPLIEAGSSASVVAMVILGTVHALGAADALLFAPGGLLISVQLPGDQLGHSQLQLPRLSALMQRRLVARVTPRPEFPSMSSVGMRASPAHPGDVRAATGLDPVTEARVETDTGSRAPTAGSTVMSIHR